MMKKKNMMKKTMRKTKKVAMRKAMTMNDGKNMNMNMNIILVLVVTVNG
jgi:hypothetical protein